MPGKRPHIGILCLLVLFLWGVSPSTPAQAAPVCARVKIEILQELALERIAFDARLVMTNDLPDQQLQNISINLKISDETGADAAPLFFVKVFSLDKISGVDGTGFLPPQVAGEVHWMLIPSPGAGGVTHDGKKYFIGGDVNFSVDGSAQNMSLMPAMITVRPQPELTLDYFLPREVWADDPFTDAVEPPVPFTLGVRTMNDGYGIATNLTINSGQPKIVETDDGRAVQFNGTTDGLVLDVNPIQGLDTFSLEVVFRPDADGPEEQRFVHIEENGSGNRALGTVEGLFQNWSNTPDRSRTTGPAASTSKSR